MPAQYFACGGDGHLNAEGKSELAAFSHHLRTHRGVTDLECRFCVERMAAFTAKGAPCDTPVSLTASARTADHGHADAESPQPAAAVVAPLNQDTP